MADAAGTALGGLLRAYRERCLLSQDQLARRCGLSVRTIRNLEGGRVGRPRGDSIRLIADALGLTDAERSGLTAPVRPATGAPVARQLPLSVPDFTGREPQVGLLTAALAGPGVPVVAVAGTAGVGKTALALHVAHEVAGRYPDGQLYVDLRGAGPDPVPPAAVLDRFLRALDVPGAAIPADEADRAAAYRSVLAGRRVLVVLDDAADEAQVRPLLPGGAGCAVLVTSRTRLLGLAGARLFDLAVLDPGPAVELLARVAGPDRVAADPASAAAIVESCGRLPLAVRIAGARLAARPAWPLDRLRVLLADEHGRLDQLAAGDLAVRASLGLSYTALGEEERRAFRALGAVGLRDFAGWVMAPLLDVPVPRAQQLVEALVDAQLLDQAGGDRYRFHELVRLYARDRSGPAEQPARDRLTGCWLALAEEADRRLPAVSYAVTDGPAPRWRLPAATVDGLLADPLGWLDLERDNLVAAVEAGPAGPAWELAGRLVAYLLIRSDWSGGTRVTRAARAACERDGDARGEAAMDIFEAWAMTTLNPAAVETGREWVRRSLRVFTELDDTPGQTYALLKLAALAPYGALDGGWAAQRAWARRALTLARRTGAADRQLQAHVLLGDAAQAAGQPREAGIAYRRARTLARRLGAVQVEADLLSRLALSRWAEGRPEEAVGQLEQALGMLRDIGERAARAETLAVLGGVLLDAGRPAEAEARLAEADATWPPTERRPRGPRFEDLTGRLWLRRDRPDEAAPAFLRAADGWDRQGRQDHRAASLAAAEQARRRDGQAARRNVLR